MRNKFKILLLLYCLYCCFELDSAAMVRKARACLQPTQSGNCFGYVPSYAYNPFDRKCEQFVYGGCGGNDNRFDTRIECELSCRGI